MKKPKVSVSLGETFNRPDLGTADAVRHLAIKGARITGLRSVNSIGATETWGRVEPEDIAALELEERDLALLVSPDGLVWGARCWLERESGDFYVRTWTIGD